MKIGMGQSHEGPDHTKPPNKQVVLDGHKHKKSTT